MRLSGCRCSRCPLPFSLLAGRLQIGGDILAISDELRLTEAEWVWLRSHLGILYVSEYTDANTKDLVRSINLKLECMAATIAKLPPSYL